MLLEKKVWGYVQVTVLVTGPILVLGEGATPAFLAVPAIAAAMGVATDNAVLAVVAKAGVTQA